MASKSNDGSYGIVDSRRKEVSKPLKPPKLLIVELDVKVSMHERNREVTFPHDNIIRIIRISKGSWHTTKCDHTCIYMYTDGYVREITQEDGRKPLVAKVESSGHVKMTCRIFESINPAFVTICIGFNHGLSYMAALCANIEGLTDTFDEMRLDDVGAFFGSSCTGPCVRTRCTPPTRWRAKSGARSSWLAFLRVTACLQNST